MKKKTCAAGAKGVTGATAAPDAFSRPAAWLLGVLLLGPASTADAQALFGSKSSSSIASAPVGDGGTVHSESVLIETGCGQATSGAVSSSPSFQVQSGVLSVDPNVSFVTPLALKGH